MRGGNNMYYENKRTFYIKQYGPAALILLVALVLIGTGIYLAVKPDANNLQANKDNTNNTPSEVITTNQYTLSDQAYEGKVIAVNGLSIKIEANGSINEVNLIGIKQNKNNKSLSNKISEDLTGKNVTVDFDSVKVEGGKTYAYIYVNKSLYNETLLAQGLAELRPEKQNINKLDVLLAAQLTAKHDMKGIWSY